MLTKEKKKRIVSKFKVHEGDTGSPEVQIALLSRRIDDLSGHLKDHKKDNHSRRGLLRMVNKRRKLLTYLSRTDEKRYKQVIKELKLKK